MRRALACTCCGQLHFRYTDRCQECDPPAVPPTRCNAPTRCYCGDELGHARARAARAAEAVSNIDRILAGMEPVRRRAI